MLMSLLRWKFSLYFLASITDEEFEQVWELHKVCQAIWWIDELQTLYPDLNQGEFDPEKENKVMVEVCALSTC